VLTHAPPTLVRTFFMQAGKVLTSDGIVVATFLRGEVDYTGTDWVYPELIQYRLATLTDWAAEAGLRLLPIRWPHRNQTYFVAVRPETDLAEIFQRASTEYGIILG
jgi:hypothetical protein